jgi:DNA-binding beta-propeller fold protein YncE
MPEAYNLRGMWSLTKGRAMTRRSVLTGLLALLLGPALPLFAAVPTQVLWSVSSFGDNDYFVKPSDIEVDRGRSLLYVADAGSCRILVFDAAGKFLRAVGRKGQGPGELATPTGLCLTADGGFAVADRDNNRIQLFGPDGVFVRSVTVKQTRVADLVVADGRYFTVPSHGVSTYSVVMGSESDNQPLVVVLDEQGRTVQELAVPDFPEKQPFVRAIKHRVSLALSPDGRLFLPFYAMNLVRVFDLAGNDMGGFSRPLPFKPMSPVLIEERSPEQGVVQMRASLDIVSPAAAFGPDGRLYILTATESLGERLKKPEAERGLASMRVDVIDPGTRTAVRTIPCDPNIKAFGVLEAGRLVYVCEDAEGELALKCVRY